MKLSPARKRLVLTQLNTARRWLAYATQPPEKLPPHAARSIRRDPFYRLRCRRQAMRFQVLAFATLRKALPGGAA